MAQEMIYYCFMGVTHLGRAHVHDVFIILAFKKKIHSCFYDKHATFLKVFRSMISEMN